MIAKNLRVLAQPPGSGIEADPTEPNHFVRLGYLQGLLVGLEASTHVPVTVTETNSAELVLQSGTQNLRVNVRRKTSLDDYEGLISESEEGLFIPLGVGANEAARGSDLAGVAAAVAGKSDVGHVHDLATTTTDGFMSAADKEKLDGLSENTIRKYAVNVGNAVDLVYDLVHGLATRDVQVGVRLASGTMDGVFVDWRILSEDSIRLTFDEAPDVDQFRCVVVG